MRPAVRSFLGDALKRLFSENDHARWSFSEICDGARFSLKSFAALNRNFQTFKVSPSSLAKAFLQHEQHGWLYCKIEFHC